MKIWKIDGINLQPLLIKADNFDTAIEKARLINKGYSGGKIVFEKK